MARDRAGLPVVLLAAFPLLGVQLGIGFLRFQARRKRAVRAFRRTLVRDGIPPDQAARLARTYHEAGSLRSILLGVIRRPA